MAATLGAEAAEIVGDIDESPWRPDPGAQDPVVAKWERPRR